MPIVSACVVVQLNEAYRSRDAPALRSILRSASVNHIRVLANESRIDMENNVLEEIEDWKLEAKLERSERYFFHTKVTDRISVGKKSFVIGRKGTGKTAIGEYLSTLNKNNCFAVKLSFKNFPFNLLYAQQDISYTAPNQYVSVWKYLIYTSVCKLMSGNNGVDVETRSELSKLFTQDIKNALPNAVNEWTDYNFDVKVLGTGIGFGKNKKQQENSTNSISERVEALEGYIRGRLGDSTYLIIFDELDEDYKNMLEKDNYLKYTQLLTSLFKASQDVKSRFNEFRLYPVVFLRDDIYDVLQDPDKTKWEDYRINLDWSREALQNLLAFRISRAIDPTGEILPFAKAWGKIFKGGKVKYGNNQQSQMSSFDYITRSTQNRPRDYIRYMQVCAEKALEKGESAISPNIVKAQDKAFSNYLRSELEDEIHGIIPEIREVLGVFSALRKQTMSVEQFALQYGKAVDAGAIQKRDVNFVLEVLFIFSIIGNVPKQSNYHVFRYKNPDARLNFNENFCVHRGLFKALQIL